MKEKESGDCTIDWEEDCDNDNDCSPYGSPLENAKEERRINKKMKDRMSRYVKGDSTKNKSSTFDYDE